MILTNLRNAVAAATLTVLLGSPALAADRAQELVNSLGCKGCHKIGGSGGTLGPALDGVGKRLGEKQLHDKLVNPKATNPQSMMPPFANLPEKDLRTLVDYLKGL